MPDSRDGAPELNATRLTPEARRRLRPTVDATTLEQFLRAAPDLPRGALVAHFATAVTLDDVLSFMRAMREAGDVSATEADECERLWRETWPDEEPGRPEGAPDPSGLRYVPVPHNQYVLQIEPPLEPTLRALWDAIEPDRA